MELKEIRAKNILTHCKIPGIGFVINPYIGCSFACKYCYASFMGRFVDKKIDKWGSYVFAKINAPELLKKEIKKLKDKGKGKEIFFSSVTDPYQGVEVKYKLTRQCLQILLDEDYRGLVSILTKSDLVLRDMDLLKKIKNVAVGLTVTSTDDGISRYFEKFAPSVLARFKALKILKENKIPTYSFIGPLLPHFVANESQLENIFKKLVEVGTKSTFVEHLNLSSYIRERLLKEIKDADKKIIEKFYLSQTKDYREKLDQIVDMLARNYKIKLLNGGTIFHREHQQKGN